ncbi:MAG TPA: hypothetical protein VK083_02050 [Nocardia sp.]|uniref:hypothetical protein n=1 Tax=Nocardia TaxID=1817 RepID=UPI0024561323|nr:MULTISPECIES: hypothetical protein [Nocardia]HLS75557.1 hypothetical protein [Nocardia sp.]
MCLCAAGFALGVALPASATVTGVKTLPNLGYGMATNYGTDCPATIQAFVTDPVAPVHFYDNGVPLATVAPTGGVALLTWTPATPGTHRISAVQSSDPAVTRSVDVAVGYGEPVGFGCAVFGG